MELVAGTPRQISLTINGQKYSGRAEPRTLLTYFLRDELGLTGTHIGCIVGKCGACSIILDGKLVKSCLIFAQQVDGAEILTVEGLAEGSKLHNPRPSEKEIREGISGNLCMCTGYVNIVKSVKAAAERMAPAKSNARPSGLRPLKLSRRSSQVSQLRERR